MVIGKNFNLLYGCVCVCVYIFFFVNLTPSLHSSNQLFTQIPALNSLLYPAPFLLIPPCFLPSFYLSFLYFPFPSFLLFPSLLVRLSFFSSTYNLTYFLALSFLHSFLPYCLPHSLPSFLLFPVFPRTSRLSLLPILPVLSTLPIDLTSHYITSSVPTSNFHYLSVRP